VCTGLSLPSALCAANLINSFEASGILTYFLRLTPCSRVLLEKLTGFQIVKKFPAFYGTPKVHFRSRKCPPPVPILSQLDPVHTPTSHFLKFHLNIILSSLPEPLKLSLSFRFPHQNPLYASHLPHTRYMLRPSHSSRLYITRTVLGEEYRSSRSFWFSRL